MPRPSSTPSSICAAVIVGHELAAADLAEHLALVRQIGRGLRIAAHEQVGGTPVDRHIIDLVLGPRSLDDRLVIAGDEAGILAQTRNLQRHEIFFEEGARPGAVGNLGRARRAARFAQCHAERPRIRRRVVLRRDRLAACAKGLVGGELVVIVPAGNVGPGQREILAAGYFGRQIEFRIGQGAFSVRAARRGAIASDAPPSRRAASSPARPRRRRAPRCMLQTPDVSECFPCQPASSSDRVRRCRGQRSRRP